MSRRTWTLVLCCLAQFMVILDVSIVNVALPSIREDLGFSASNLQWVVNAYTLTFAGFLLLGGRAADLLGRRRVFIAGLLLFAGASLLGGLSTSQGMLIGARAAQGLGGAVVAPATLSILTTTFAEGAERNRALAFWGAMGGAGGAAGALLGGVLTDLLGWEWIFFVNVPIGVGAAIAAQRFVEEGRLDVEGRRTFALAGGVTVTAGLVLLCYGIVRTDVKGWGSAETLGAIGAGLALIGVFLFIEGRLSARPLMPLDVWKSRTLAGANIVVFFLGASIFAMWYFVSLYLQLVLGYSAIEAGLAFLPMTIAIIVGSTLAGRSAVRVGAGKLLTFGMGLAAIGMLLFARVAVDGHYLSDVMAPALIVAVGLGLSFVPVTIAAVAGVEPRQAGLASGLVNPSRQVGGSLGLAVLATLATSRAHAVGTGPDALVAGFHRAFEVGAGFAALGALGAGGLRAPGRAGAGGGAGARAPAGACGGAAGARRSLGPRQALVGDAVRAVGLVAEPLALVLLVGLEVALEPDDLRVALEGEHVRGHAVEEPAVVGDDHRAAGEVEQRLLERAQGVDVEVVGRLVEQEDVPALAQQLHQVHAVAHAAAQRAHLLLLVGALEVEARAVGARIHLAVPRP